MASSRHFPPLFTSPSGDSCILFASTPIDITGYTIKGATTDNHKWTKSLQPSFQVPFLLCDRKSGIIFSPYYCKEGTVKFRK